MASPSLITSVYSPRLAAAVARYENTQTVLKVVDESLEKSRELREERKKTDEERRAREARESRIAEAERAERESVEEMRLRLEDIAEQIAKREAARAETLARQSG